MLYSLNVHVLSLKKGERKRARIKRFVVHKLDFVVLCVKASGTKYFGQIL